MKWWRKEIKKCLKSNLWLGDREARSIILSSRGATTDGFLFSHINIRWLCVLYFQTAEMILKHNSSCSGLPMACDPLLKEVVSGTYLFSPLHIYLLINTLTHPVSDLLFCRTLGLLRGGECRTWKIWPRQLVSHFQASPLQRERLRSRWGCCVSEKVDATVSMSCHHLFPDIQIVVCRSLITLTSC